jgi:peptidoglycan/LPS O-acetylase OafA/YrhL
MTQTPNKEHILVLDGVRGIAVLLVLLFHFLPDTAMQWRSAEWFKKTFTTGGWVGVDLFFVLSGFLITGILLRSKSSENYFATFYIRRALRIFPLYYGALIIIFVVLPYLGLLSGESFEPYRKMQAYFWFYLSNVSRWLVNEDTLAALPAPVGFGHLWSLAVEEHFYLVWPAVIFVSSISTLRKTCYALVFSAFFLRCLALSIGNDNAMHPFLLTPLRWDALATGALVATWYHEGGLSGLQRLGRWPNYSLAIGGAALILFFYLFKGLWPDHWMMRSIGFSIVALVWAALLIKILLGQNGPIGSIVSSKLFRFFGKYSYGIYLIHGFLRPALGQFMPTEPWLDYFSFAPLLGGFLLAGVKIALCTILAMFTWHWFEFPILKLNRRFPYRYRQSMVHPSNSQLKSSISM